MLVLGDIILDQFIWGDVDRISPEAPVPVVLVRREEFRLGGAGNVAANIRALGGRPILVGVINNDTAGELIQHEMDRLTCQLRSVLTWAGRPSSRPGSSPTPAGLPGRPGSPPADVDGAVQEVAPVHPEVLARTQRVMVSDYGKGFINQRLLSNILPMAQRAGTIVAVDPKNRDFAMYRPATILTPNKKEAEFASGIPIHDEASLKKAAKAILKDTQVENLLITRGEEGMSLFRPTGYWRHIPAFAREVFDVTGAGDTVIATLALAMCAGANPEEAAILANSAAGSWSASSAPPAPPPTS